MENNTLLDYLEIYQNYFREDTMEWEKDAYSEIQHIEYGEKEPGFYYVRAMVKTKKELKRTTQSIDIYPGDAQVISRVVAEELGVNCRKIGG